MNVWEAKKALNPVLLISAGQGDAADHHTPRNKGPFQWYHGLVITVSQNFNETKGD
jgi:hypothetical protein